MYMLNILISTDITTVAYGCLWLARGGHKCYRGVNDKKYPNWDAEKQEHIDGKMEIVNCSIEMCFRRVDGK